MTAVSKNLYINKLDDMINQHNNTYHTYRDNTYHRTIKMKPIEVKYKTYIDSTKEVNDKNSKFRVGDLVRISKYKNIYAKGYTPNWSEEVFVIKKVKNTVPWTYIINDLNGEEIIGNFYKKELQKTNQQGFKMLKLYAQEVFQTTGQQIT